MVDKEISDFYRLMKKHIKNDEISEDQLDKIIDISFKLKNEWRYNEKG